MLIGTIQPSVLVVVVVDLEIVRIVVEIKVIVLKLFLVVRVLIIVPLELIVIVDKVVVILIIDRDCRLKHTHRRQPLRLDLEQLILYGTRCFNLDHETLSRIAHAKKTPRASVVLGDRIRLFTPSRPGPLPGASVGTIQLDPALSIPPTLLFFAPPRLHGYPDPPPHHHPPTNTP